MPGFPQLLPFILSSAFVAPLFAQSEAPDVERPATTIQVNAKTVIVDVVVTGLNGHAVVGLPKNDFKIAEDGKPQSITFFEEHSGLASSHPPPQA